jgi:hypothetical protein
MKRYQRKSGVARRYNISTRSVDRHVAAGVLPSPEYPLRNKVPMWDVEVLDAHDRAAALAARPKRKPENPDTEAKASP